ncbi:MAG: hypothetical protein AAF573_21240 [Bacteroidota bacterium]
MKKVLLPLVVALILIPQTLISQDLLQRNNDAVFDLKIEMTDTRLTPKGGNQDIRTLKSFELVEKSTNSMKVLASFEVEESFELKIFNEKGLSIYSENFETDELSLAMGFANLPDGAYFISLKTKDGEIIKPLQ